MACAATYNRAISVSWRWLGHWPSVDTASDVPPVYEAGAGPKRSSARSAPCLISWPCPGQCPAARLRPTALPIAVKMAIGSPLAETAGSGRKDDPQFGCGLNQLRRAAHHPQRPVSRHVQQRITRNPSLSSRSSATVRLSPADTGVRLPYQVGHYGPKIIKSVRGRNQRETS